MKKLIMISSLVSMVLFLATCKPKEKKVDNPFFSEWTTPFGVPDFSKIKNEHYIPAFEEAMRQQKEEIDAIIQSKEEPTFENVIAAIDYTGSMLDRVSSVFFNMTSANTNEEIQKIAQEISPKLAAHSDDILLNPELFKKVEAVYNKKAELNLNTEQQMLLDLTYKGFVRSGAKLDAEKQKRLREINQDLSLLTLQFSDNMLAEINNFQLVIDNEADLAGLPTALVETAAETAKTKGMEGKWIFTLHNPSVMPFLQHAENRELRKQMQQAFVNRNNNNNEWDNKEIVKKVIALRIERAQMLGYDTHADFILEMNMAENKENVFKLLNQLWTPALNRAKGELKAYNTALRADGIKDNFQQWDWRYYAEKHRKTAYDLNEEEVKQYFELNKVKEGIFWVTNQLFGLTYTELKDIPKYHEDVVAYEVKREDGSHVGVLFMDFHPRESKRGGAWMSSFRKQQRNAKGEFIHPIITIVCNFTKPTATTPSLLTMDETSTFFHEFGHALHGLLSQGTYPKLTGTSVPRDFVELPAQIMEHWAFEPEVLRHYAKHYKTGETIPEELIQKIQKSGHFDQGFATVEFLASSFLDMFYHTKTESKIDNPVDFENAKMKEIGLIPEIVCRHRSTYFAHIFTWGYSAGYYSYIWSAVLDSDAFAAFQETSIFDKKTADSFRTNILERGHSDTPMNLWKAFRGREPIIEPLLKKRGLN